MLDNKTQRIQPLMEFKEQTPFFFYLRTPACDQSINKSIPTRRFSAYLFTVMRASEAL